MGDEKLRPSNNTIEVVLRDLESLLRGKLGNSLAVDSFTTSNLVPQGENYGSTMLKVDAEVRRDAERSDCESEKLSFVAKMTPPTEFQKMIFDSPSTFPKEIFMFTDIVPAFKALELESGIPEAEVFDPLPELYGSRLSLDEAKDKFDHDAVILMENLKLNNYACHERRIGVDLAHAISVVEALARFHGLGIAVKMKKPQLFEEFKIHATSIKVDDKIMKEFNELLIVNVKKVPSLLPHLARIEKVLLDSSDGQIMVTAPVEPWGTIVHRDLWVNNIMFRDDVSGNPEGVKFVDFQHYGYQNPLRDLVFFLFSSCNAEVRSASIEDLVDLYYDKLTSHLARLKCNVNLFTRLSFNEQLVDAAYTEYAHCVLMTRFIIMDQETDPASKVAIEEVCKVEATDEYREQITEITLKFIKENWI